MKKLKKLKSILQGMDSVLVAYSGGVDSTLLLKISRDVLGDNVLAVTAVSATYPAEELAFSKRMARALKARHRVIRTSELADGDFIANSSQRCYFCKRELFSRLKDIAKKNKLEFVLDASNVSDKTDFRPGVKAKEELGVRSPLQEAGLTKEDIRKLSKKLKLATWDKPSLACLASRVPYGVKISPSLLNRINQAERFLRNLGFKQIRLRHYNGLCRIEVAKNDISRFFSKRDLITSKIKAMGYDYVTLDLEGYRTGSMNEVLKRG